MLGLFRLHKAFDCAGSLSRFWDSQNSSPYEVLSTLFIHDQETTLIYGLHVKRSVCRNALETKNMNVTTEYRKQIYQENCVFLDGLPIPELLARSTGAFFSSIESICDVVRIRVAASQFPNIQRNQAQGERLYPDTVNAHYLKECLEADSDKSDTTNTLQIFTSVDFLFNLKGHKAHLMPNHSACHVAYTKIVQAATGTKIVPTELRGLLDCDLQRRKLMNGIKARDRRMNGSGIKHSKYNKFHLLMKEQYLDSNPVLIIVPILTLSQIKDWDGTSSYNAMVLPCGQQGKDAAESVMRHVRYCCDVTDVQTGIEVLCHFIRDIAESLIDVDQDILEDVQIYDEYSRDPSLVRWKMLVNELRGDQASIEIPVLKNGLEWEKVKVAREGSTVLRLVFLIRSCWL
jgi:hypothetical protein